MSLLLILEGGPRPQAVHQARLDEGELVIGRSASADWQIDDPDMFVSRAHCTVRGGREGYVVTDTSSSGLFIDDSPTPLGAGNSAPLRHGMRLRLGDYVLWVEIEGDAARPAPVADAAAARSRPAADAFDGDDFFSAPLPERSERPRPSGLPDPFEQPAPGAYTNAVSREPAHPSSPGFDDPFSLDPLPSTPESTEPAAGLAVFGDFTAPAPDFDAAPRSAGQGFDGGFGFVAQASPSSGAASAPPFAEDFAPPARSAPQPAPARHPEAARPAAAKFVPASAPRANPRVGLDAFLRAAGMDPTAVSDAEAEATMIKLGREYRAMMDGLMLLLRKRAEEKNNARVAATVVGASDVNPLKFMPRVEDALEIVITGRSPGFLSGEEAIEDAVRDLAHHHLRAWRGIQSALRRMIDRFDPARIEEELKDASTVGTLLSGGRAAKLWELYKKRHREISRSAEERFMGEVGADFRNAYEEE